MLKRKDEIKTKIGAAVHPGKVEYPRPGIAEGGGTESLSVILYPDAAGAEAGRLSQGGEIVVPAGWAYGAGTVLGTGKELGR